MSDGYEVRDVDPVLGEDDRVGVAEAADVGLVEPRLDREDHARLDGCVVADVEEGCLVVAQADRVPDVLAPVGQQAVVLEVRETARSTSAHVVPGRSAPNATGGVLGWWATCCG